MNPGGLDEYIRDNRAKYTDQAIRETLIAVGHDPATVDAAFHRLGLEAPQASDPVKRAGMSALVGLALVLYIFFGILGLAGISMASTFGYGGRFPFFIGAYFGIGLALVLLLRFAVSRVEIRGIWSALLGLALFPVFIGLMLGTCAAAAGSLRV